MVRYCGSRKVKGVRLFAYGLKGTIGAALIAFFTYALIKQNWALAIFVGIIAFCFNILLYKYGFGGII